MPSTSDRIKSLETEVRELRTILSQQRGSISEYRRKAPFRDRLGGKSAPKRWLDEQALVRDLRHYDWKGWFYNRRKAESHCDLPTTVGEAIGGNTFRAFKKYRGRRPSETFRDWAVQALERRFLVRFLKIQTQAGFDSWLVDFVKDLQKHWKRRMGREIPLGPGFKLPNLLVKRLCLFNKVDDRTFTRIVQFMHVPLDSYTLQALACCPELKIRSTATMSFIKDLKTYESIQARVRQVATKANVPPIALDCLAWDEGHRP